MITKLLMGGLKGTLLHVLTLMLVVSCQQSDEFAQISNPSSVIEEGPGPEITPPSDAPPISEVPPVDQPPAEPPVIIVPPTIYPIDPNPQPTPPIAELPPVVDPVPPTTPPVVELPPVVPPVVDLPPAPPIPDPGDDNDICKKNPSAPACSTIPVVKEPGVVTILMALGDMDNNNNNLVIKEDSSQLVAMNAIKYASPVINPKILLIRDHNHNGESPNDIKYIRDVLLKGYDVTYFEESSYGITSPGRLMGYDLIWFNNPGHPFGSLNTFNQLLNFKGGIILSGDDLGRGNGFSTTPLTGLRYVDNGTSVNCGNSRMVNIDNNTGAQYSVNMVQDFLPGIPADLLKFSYGNDIDNTVMSGITSNSSGVINASNYEILAIASVELASGQPCAERRPAIVRYKKSIVP